MPIIAQIPQDLWPRVVEIGLAAPLIWWITSQMSAKIDLLASKMDDNTWSIAMMAKTQLITLIALGQLDSPVKIQAEGVLREITKKEEDHRAPDRSRLK